MLAAAKWYALVTLAGWLAWPLAFRHLRHLPDRGYLTSRAIGLLLVGYVFWLLASLGLVANTPGAMMLAALVVGGVGIWQYQSRPNTGESLRGWLREHGTLVLVAEGLFLAAFVAWTVVRAYDPALNTTEKPMELTFLNGIRQSAVFPPQDPWLAGYAISYYYFGYVLVAMLADLSGTASAMAFNLGVALVFALTLLGAYAVVYNLIALHGSRDGPTPREGVLAALLGPLLVGVTGNLAGALELLRALRLPRADAFWAWLDVADLNGPLQAAIAWPPSGWRTWWWWRASRVIHDRDLTGTPIGLQPIDEFPMFSFLLGDLHPHVLALPFVLLALGLALNLAASPSDDVRPLQPEVFVFYALAAGALGFLNVWDLPTSLFLVTVAEGLRLSRRPGGFGWDGLGRAALFGVSLLALALALYLPFYLSFGSQAGGILPNVLFPTRLPNFLVMFGPLLFIVGWFAVWQATRRTSAWLPGAGLALGALVLLAGVMALGGSLALKETPVQDFLLTSAGFDPSGPERQAALAEAVSMAATRRLRQPAVALLLTALLATCAAVILRRRDSGAKLHAGSGPMLPAEFAALLTGTGALLTLAPEFVYVRDVFGQRINTVFKFYYGAWALWGVAAAYAAWAITRQMRGSRALHGVFVALATALVTAGLVYPALAIPSKANFRASPTLDGIAFVAELSPGDLDGIRWLQANGDPQDVVLEAIGGQYSFYGRVSSMTGMPTLMGWAGHELQWRGSLDEAGSREADVQTIYTTPDIRTAQLLLEQYDVTYIFVGSLERGYGTPDGLQKFERFLTPAYQNGEVTIYRADQPLTVVIE